MTDDIQYRYRDLLEHLESGSQKLNESIDYAQYLQTMEKADSLKDIMLVFDNVITFQANIFYNRKNLDGNWYQHEFWGYEPSHHVQELCCYLNENILMWYQRQSAPSGEHLYSCLANLRECKNIDDIAKQLLSTPCPNAGEDAHVITSKVTRHYLTRLDLYKKRKSSIQYPTALNQYKDLSYSLAQYGRIFDVIEVAFGKEHGIDYSKLDRSIKLRNNKKKEKSKTKDILFLIITIVIVMIVMMYLAIQIGFIGIIICIGFVGLTLSGKIFHM